MSFLIPKGLGMLAPDKTDPHPLAPSNSTGMGSILGNALSNYPPPPPSPSLRLANALTGALSPLEPRPTLAEALYGQRTKRKAYFAFRFEDIMRVNNVRKIWCIDHPDSPMMRSFYDRSMWGKSKAREPETLKALMRNAVVQSSAVCVLIGTNGDAVDLPRYIPSISQGYVMPLSRYTSVYDYANIGHKNIGAWIDRAATAVGR
jgi:hypothetical protein